MVDFAASSFTFSLRLTSPSHVTARVLPKLSRSLPKLTISPPKLRNAFSPANPLTLSMAAGNLWCEEEIETNLKWCYSIIDILATKVSKFQDISLIKSGPFGKVLLLDGKMQSTECDEYAYHESLVHPALLHHPNPKTVFILGGGEGFTAREVLKHPSVEKCVMCDIDKDVVDFCKEHLDVNKEAFADPRLELIIDDAKAELANSPRCYDVIIADLADPVDAGPCFNLYTEEFYEQVLRPRLNPGGIFVTQSGPAGILSHKEIFTPIYKTMEAVFSRVVPYAVHLPSFADQWGFNMSIPVGMEPLTEAELDARIAERISSELGHLDGKTWLAMAYLTKKIRKSLREETTVYREGHAPAIYGHGIGNS
eukprot:jgi/Mesvir1/16496/Mv10049-RA.1